MVAKTQKLAHNTVAAAVQRGQLNELRCELCGQIPTIAHHEDYAKPYEVRWLCRRCHHGQPHRNHGEPSYKLIKIGPDVDAELARLMGAYQLDSANKVLRHLLDLSHRDCANIEEARQRGCAICLSRLS